MVRKLNQSDGGFDTAFEALIGENCDDGGEVARSVAGIVADVRTRGFAALVDYTKKFDRFTLNAKTVFVSEEEVKKAEQDSDPEIVRALAFAARRIRSYHEKQLPDDVRYIDDDGVTLGWRWTAVDAAGLYAPGGLASYPSSVLMSAIPAQVAGVRRICLCTPAPGGEIKPLVLVAAKLTGIAEIYRVGGAQAIAAMAFGADPIKPVDVIVGPGNAYVAEAKRQVFGKVGIDSIAGPSEILVVADGKNDPAWIAADLLSQAEHDPSSQSILITNDERFAEQVASAVAEQLAMSPRRKIAEAAWERNSAIIVVSALADAPSLVNRIAPEHLELAVEDPEALLAKVRHAGAIFLGRHTPEAVGDYVAGPNHVLPTGGRARFSSGLSVLDFMKRTSIIGCGPEGLSIIGDVAAKLADAEGLPSHAYSIRARRKGRGK